MIPKLILTQTPSGVASVSFTSNIDSTYDEYMFVFTNINPDNSMVEFTFQGSTDGGSSYGITKTTVYYRAIHKDSDGQADLTQDASRDMAQSTAAQQIMSDLGNDADHGSAGIFHLYSPASTTYVKHFMCRTSNNHVSGGDPSARDVHVAGYWNTTTAINAIQFGVSGGNFNGTIQMYGIE